MTIPSTDRLIRRVTALPSNPEDAQEIYYVADATNGVVWHLLYRAASSSSYKWECVGGPPLYNEVVTGESTTSTTYAALATAGPSITLPLAGDYDVEIGFRGYNNGAGAINNYMSYDIGGTGASDNDANLQYMPSSTSAHANNARSRRKTGLTAVTLTSKYRLDGAVTVGYFQYRWMKVTPVRVG